MKSSTVALIVLGVCKLVIGSIEDSAKDYAKIKAKDDAAASITEEEKIRYSDAERRCGSYKEIMDRENNELQEKMKDWKVRNNYDSRRRDIQNTSKKDLADYKEEIGYFNNVSRLELKLKSDIASFKDSINYDGEKEALEEAISDAEDHFEDLKDAFNIGEDDDDISEVAMKLRHAAEEAMNAKVKEAKGKLKELEKKLDDETERLTKIKDGKLRSIEENVENEKRRLNERAKDEMHLLDTERDSAKSDILKNILEKRTEKEKEIVEYHDNDLRIIDGHKIREEKLAKDILKSKKKHEQIGEYLASKDIPKWLVVCCGAIPLVPVAYLVSQYVGFLSNVLKSM